MNPEKSACFGCGNVVEFIATPDGRHHCPQCGAPYSKAGVPNVASRVFHTVLRAFLIVLAIVGVVTAVLFGGCIVSLRGMNH